MSPPLFSGSWTRLNSVFNSVSPPLLLRVRLLEPRCFQDLIASNANLLRVPEAFSSDAMASAQLGPLRNGAHRQWNRRRV